MKVQKLLYKSISFSLVAGLALTSIGCGKQAAAVRETAPVIDTIDDNYRVFYEIFTGSFSDSNGDGIGDLQGIINRMDYLNDGDVNSGESLGIQGIWLTPIFKSPSYHKYDVTDYYSIDPSFGTEEDLKALLDICHERNVKVILDLVINHTSKDNLWFSKFASAHKDGNTEDPFYNFYSWATTETRKSNITYQPIPNCTNEYYECNFSSDMPELNYDNEEVRKCVLDIAKYYLDLGVDGFRFDAIKYIYYGETTKSAAFWDWYMSELTAYKEDIYCVGECWSADPETLEYVSGVNCFNFQAGQGEGVITNAASGRSIDVYTGYIESYQDKVLSENSDNGMMINFLSNHDMDRAAGYLTLATHRAHMAANLYLLCSGSPFIYYGEEIGLKGMRGGENTDANRRLAMLWGDEDSIRDPKGSTYDSSKQTNGTVAEQMERDNSLYHYYCKVIALRNKYPEIARGDYTAVSFGQKRQGGFEITYGDSTIALIHNTDDSVATIDLSKGKGFSKDFTELVDYIGQGDASLEGSILTIGPQTSAILK